MRNKPTCEVVIQWKNKNKGRETILCGAPATKRYPTSNNQFMHLCDEHSVSHINYAEDILRDRDGYPDA